jgi:two-component system, sensor histidine kinase and response regulator
MMDSAGPRVPVSQTTRGKQESPTSGLPFRGFCVLLVEDNQINQLIGRTTLSGLGLTVEVADNGKTATEMLARASDRYNAVLMDLQMPIMDGYEATRIIRSDRRNQTLPIIAMTASADESEKRLCLDAGMNDLVPKPIDRNELRTTLSKWLRQRTSETEPVADDPVEKGRVESPVEVFGIDVQSALKRVLGNRAVLIRLMSDFAKDYSNVPQQVREALSGGDVNLALRILHTAKGVAGNLAATQINETVRDLELGVKEAKSAAIQSGLERLERGFRSFSSSLEALSRHWRSKLQVAQSSDGPAVEWADLSGALEELDYLLERNSLSSRDKFRLIHNSLLGTDFRGKADELATLVARLDFKQARELLTLLGRTLGTTSTGQAWQPQEQKQTVLIVDDTVLGIELLAEALGTEYDILFAKSGQSAQEVAFGQAPDLILLDVMMPDMDGFEVCRRLKADPRTKAIPVIFITAMEEESDESYGLKVGGIDYIIKPFRPLIVRARVRNHLELKRIGRERELLIRDLQDSLVKIQTLQGLLPICAWCKRVRDDQGYWTMVETYFSQRSQAQFSHGICPECLAQELKEGEL